MRDRLDRRVLVVNHERRSPYKVGQWAPHRVDWFIVRLARRDLFLRWCPWHGLQVIGSGAIGSPYPEVNYQDPHKKVKLMKRRSAVAPEAAIVPALSSESKILNKLAHLREFLSATAYEDGTARTPGYLWLSNRRHLYEVVLFDPDSGARLPLTALTLDDVLALADTMLATDGAAWMPDKYLSEQLAKRSKKKSA